MPARRPGAVAQKSASQRLWARSPSQRRSRSPASAGRRLVDERRLREERRDRVREDDLGHDAVGLQLGEAAVAVPVAGGAVALEVVVRVPNADRQRVEPFVERRRQVRAVVVDGAAAMAVGRDDRVALHSAPPVRQNLSVSGTVAG